jgi:HEPN domain-containing protein
MTRSASCDLERRRDDPGTIEWDVAREGRVLLADPAASRVLVPRDRVRESSPKPPESVQEWVEAAAKDLRHARLHLDDTDGPDDYSPEICWLSHQAAEKYMKALLVSRRVRPRRTHDLVDLLAALRRAGCELRMLDDDCALLTKHAIKPRDPAGQSLREKDARLAFEAVERLVAAVRAQLTAL